MRRYNFAQILLTPNRAFDCIHPLQEWRRHLSTGIDDRGGVPARPRAHRGKEREVRRKWDVKGRLSVISEEEPCVLKAAIAVILERLNVNHQSIIKMKMKK